MASLTDTLEPITAAKGVGVSASSTSSSDTDTTLQGLASFGKSVFAGLGQQDERARQAATFAHTQQEWAQQQTANQAQNDTAQSVIDANHYAQALATPNDPVDDLLGTTAASSFLATQNVVRGIQSATTAVDQGRAPPETLEMYRTSETDRLLALYPTQKAPILKMLHEGGYDHPMFQQQQLQAKAQDAAAGDVVAEQSKWFQAAVDGGLALPGQTREETLQYGRAALIQQANLKFNLDTLDQKSKKNALVDSQHKEDDWQQAHSESEAVKAINANNALRIGATSARLQAIVGALTPDQQQQLGNQTTNITAGFAAVENNIRPQIAKFSQPAQDAIIKNLDAQRDGMLAYWNPKDPASFQMRQANQLQITQDKFGLDAARTYPLMSILGKSMPPPMMSQYVRDISPDLANKIGQELKIGDPLNQDNYQVHVFNAMAMMKGILGPLENLPIDQRTPAVQAAVSAVKGGAQAFNSGDKSPRTVAAFTHSYESLSTSATALNRGASIGAFAYATDAVAGQDALTGIRAVQGTPQAKVVTQNSRIAAAHLYTELKASGSDDSPGKYQNVQFNVSGPQAGKWSVNFNDVAFKKAYDAGQIVGQNNDRSANFGITNTQQSYADAKAQFQGNADPALAQKVTALNKNLDFLDQTRQYDPDSLKMTPLQYRIALQQGQPTTKQQAAPASTPTSDPKVALQAQVDSLVHDLSVAPGETATAPGGIVEQSKYVLSPQATALKTQLAPIIAAESAKNGVNPQVVTNLITHESRFDPNADAHKTVSTSHALGLGQFQPGTAENLGATVSHTNDPSVPDDRRDPKKAVAMTAQYLGQLLRSNKGNLLASLRQYSGGSYDDNALHYIMNNGV